ncbi:CASP-like protein 4D1 [Daucus carota subsp. sativus]|uniref:CASP-like protein 4D1 n=1 Tax=Daucus carota subsp. sativus TaxID=79200 RepID=UPI003083064B
MAISSKTLVNTSLLLRILSLLVLAASVVVMVTNTVTDIDGSKDHFTILTTYRYVLAIGAVGFLYTLVQIPFAVYYVCTEKRLIRNGCLPIFDFYGDIVISFLLATASGAGFAATYELKKLVVGVVGFGETTKFLNRGYISIGLLFAGSVCMVILSILSSNLRNSTGRGGFFG